MNNIKAWVVSLRLRTLPLALSTIFMGSVLAAQQNLFNGYVLLWAALTTLFLQILSNLSNDYGDALSGADNALRQGPKRMIQSGVISLTQMKRAMIICALLALIAGLVLLFVSFPTITFVQFVFLLLGLASIAAAIRYTVGKKPYGYRGLGDLYVFLFFGLLGVAGTWFLHTNSWHWIVLLPAASIGFFSAGVLNLNNIRDLESDRDSGKYTLVVKIGRKRAAWYHFTLIAAGWLAISFFMFGSPENMTLWPVVFSLPFFIRNVLTVFDDSKAEKLDNELRNLSLSTLLFVVLSALTLF
ncbi:1,4-dihydroxy-2-naphthoate octaprenyltransferase [Geofilum sp. OHC36d9]|uniref:1,4-dihydroxy-2-naphthoate octaprenyltransferase n=1 Tax=Geofilum sp. OHC36d9 TaxID=3458413 RepID=UPI0040331A35